MPGFRQTLPIAIASAALLLSAGGCFVNDELTSGEQIMESHSAGKPSAAPAPGAEEPSSLTIASLRDRGNEAFGGLKNKLDEAMEKEPDPDNTILKCQVDGRVRFTRKFDCQAMGGRVLGS